MLEKAATMKIFEFSLLGKELQAQTDIAKKQYRKLNKTSEFGKIIKREKPTLENYLIFNYKHIYKFYRDSKKLDILSLSN